MAAHAIEPIGPHRKNLGDLLEEMDKASRLHGDIRQSEANVRKWKSLISDGTGFVLLDGSHCVGMLLYSAEYDLRFSSFLSASSAEKLPKSVTIYACHVLEHAREQSNSNERLLLQSSISRLRTIESIETIAVQIKALYDFDPGKTLSDLGFLSCSRVRMQRNLINPLPPESMPAATTIESPGPGDSDDLRSVIYHAYFSEIDGYLFPDIEAVCSQPPLFKEFLTGTSVERAASVMAKKESYPCGCVLVLSDEDRRLGLIGVVAVIPALRRRGIARGMMLRVMHRLKKHNHDRVALAVTLENRPAYKLYTSLGFKETGPRKAISVWRRSASRPRIRRRH